MKRALVAMLILASQQANAAEDKAKLVSILPFDATRTKLDESTRIALEESIRTEAGDVLGQYGLTVLTSDTQLKLLTDNGIDPNKACEAACHLEAARELNARYFISGILTADEEGLVAFIRLFDSATGRQLASAQLEGKTVRELRRSFATQSQTFFTKAGFGNAPAPQSAPPPPVEPPAAQAPQELQQSSRMGRNVLAQKELARHEAGDKSDMSPPNLRPPTPPAVPPPPPSPGTLSLAPEKPLEPPTGVYVPVNPEAKRSWERWFVALPSLGFIGIGKEWGYGHWAFRFGWIVLSGRWYESPISNGWYIEFGLPFGFGYQWKIVTGTFSLGLPNLIEVQF